jgi:hypothetical protein
MKPLSVRKKLTPVCPSSNRLSGKKLGTAAKGTASASWIVCHVNTSIAARNRR